MIEDELLNSLALTPECRRSLDEGKNSQNELQSSRHIVGFFQEDNGGRKPN